MELNDVGNKIKTRRKSLGISQQELAEAVGYSNKSMVSLIESGRVNVPMDKIVQIADYLKIPVSSLFFEKITVIERDDPFDGLTKDQIRRVKEYIELIRRAENGNT